MKRVLLAFAAALAWVADAGASGDYGPQYTMFKAWSAPDIPLERFQAGELGVLQPGMRRVYLYTAWRAIALGPGVASSPGLAGGLARADGSAFGHGWTGAGTEPDPALAARLATLLHLPAGDPALRQLGACAPASNDHALGVFRSASARADATPARLDAWVLAQYRVGEACQAADDWRYRYGSDKPPALTAPAPLAAGEPAYWRQLNEYQRAAWAFQSAHYADSTVLFERIGATPGHPMRELGAYLALRSEVRNAVAADIKKVDPARREQQARALEQRGAAILKDASLASMHEPTRALLRAMRAGLTPETRLRALNRYLDNPAADPYALDRLGDWAILVDSAGTQMPDLQAGHDFIDWIETLRGCRGRAAATACPLAAAHAGERWQQTRSHPWLVAALMLAESAPPALLEAGLALEPDDPAYVTVRYHLARLLRLGGQPGQARAIADALLQRKLSPGTRNLFREERFAVATSVRDAGMYLLRTNVDYAQMAPEAREDMINDDGLDWLNGGLPVTDLIDLAGLASLPQALRARIAGAAWIRAGLLDKPEQGRQAGALLAQLVPSIADAVSRHGRATTAVERRHVVLAAALRFGLAAQLGMAAEPVAPVAPGEATASGWCSFRPHSRLGDVVLVGGREAPGFGWRFPAMPDTGHAALRQQEMARLRSLKTATGTLGDDVMAWAARHPADPELPWLLYVVVQSTRGGCLDPDAGSLSRKAYTLLHKRYGGSEWAARTPYYY